MIKSIEVIVKWSLEELGMYSDDAHAMIMRTGMAESGYRALEQSGGPAIGFFQIEPETLNDTVENYINYRPQLKTKLYSIGFDDIESEIRLMSNIALQAAFCRLKYRRDSKPIPKWDDIEGQAKYWKRIYNSELGRGTVEHFIKANHGYELSYEAIEDNDNG